MRTSLILVVLFTLTGCALGGVKTRAQLPDSASAVVPRLQVVERRVYVKVPAHLTKRSAVTEGSLPQCFDVAAQRRQVMEEQNARLE